MENVKGFKVFHPDWTCRGFQYEVGKIYEEDVKPSCDIGFHFCKNKKHWKKPGISTGMEGKT